MKGKELLLFARFKTNTPVLFLVALRSTRDHLLLKIYSKACIKGFLNVIQSYSTAFQKLTNFYHNLYFAKH